MGSNLPAARDVVFDPRSTEPVTLRNNNIWLNQFRGLTLKPQPGDSEIYKWLLHWLCNEDSEGYEYAMDWIATPLQHLYRGKDFSPQNRVPSLPTYKRNSDTGCIWL